MREVARNRPQRPASPRALRPSQLALALVSALLGFLLATQFQSREGLSTRLAGEREEDLAQILSNLSTSTDQIQDEIIDLRVRLQGAKGSAEQEKVLLDNARQQFDSLRILLGMVPVKGEGIVATIGDPSGTVGPEILLDAVEELRDAGAEAIDINGLRVVASSAFGGSPGSLSVSGTPIASPYVITAIGNGETLAEAVKIPGGVVDTINARQAASIIIEERKEVRIASLRPAPRFTYATPT
ncbi:MAG: DUF881 domain-containing protein [Actinomycetota bacterium]|nr:DUF881 domain-containing protein [Actinomycetota bacterium]